MELPTYTNIWKIEKRLYKLYDFRLPMPLPVGQVAAFLAIAIPYTLILTMAGMPFSHTWLWLYLLPPGALAWLVTRPVLEGKRLPELLMSQLRYLTEPRVWCRMAPASEPDQIFVVARVWRSAALLATAAVITEDLVRQSAPDLPRSQDVPESAEPKVAEPEHPEPEHRDVEVAELEVAELEVAELEVAEPVQARAQAAAEARPEPPPASSRDEDSSANVPEPPRPVWPTRPSIGHLDARTAEGTPAERTFSERTPAVCGPAEGTQTGREPAERGPAERGSAERGPEDREPAERPVRRPAITVRTDGTVSRPVPLVERALRTAPDRRNGGWGDHVVVVPGGHRPGKPDLLQRDRGRARLPLPGPARIVVLGCTAGAGQTVTTLLTGQLLASIRGQAVAVLDLSPGPGSLTEQARLIPRLLPSRRTAAEAAPDRTADRPSRERGLQVVTAAEDAGAAATGALEDGGALIDAVVARYPLMLADPSAGQVPRTLRAADQLLVVAPASADGPGALAMTFEWLEAHGHADLARAAVIALNGVTDETSEHADRTAAVAAGQCRAIVRLPWDDRLAAGQSIGAGAVRAYTALAGVLVAGLAEAHSTPAPQPARVPQPAGAPDTGGGLT
jgi:MinD-like ATPase involved in chromosome partitioning or flagellar assembly